MPSDGRNASHHQTPARRSSGAQMSAVTWPRVFSPVIRGGGSISAALAIGLALGSDRAIARQGQIPDRRTHVEFLQGLVGARAARLLGDSAFRIVQVAEGD